MVKSILKTSDSRELPDNLQDAQALAGLFQQVASESVTICRNVDPNSVPGGDKTDLAEKTSAMVGMLNEMKSKRYYTNPVSVPNNTTPLNSPPPPPPTIPVYQPQDDRTIIPTNEDNDQMELNLNPTTSEQVVDLLDKIESHLSKISQVLLRAEKRELEVLEKKATKKAVAAKKKIVKQ